MQNLLLFEYSAEAFRCHVHYYQRLEFRPSIDNGAYGTESFCQYSSK